MNLPITMRKIYINVYAEDLITKKLDKYKKHFENLPFLLEELNITVYIPNKKLLYGASLEIQKRFDLFICQIEKIPFGCDVNINYLNVQ